MGKESLSTVAAKVDNLVFSQASVELAKATLETMLEATVVVRGTRRTENGSPIYEERPDNAIRLTAAVKIIEWGEGKPRQRVELDVPSASGSSPGLQDLARLLTKNPDVLEKVVLALRDGAKLAQAIPVSEVKRTNRANPPDNQSIGPQS